MDLMKESERTDILMSKARNTGIVRNIDDAGRIVVPKEYRKILGIAEKESAVEIRVEGDSIILNKYSPSCIFCGENKNILDYNGRKICKACIENLSKLNER